MFFFLVIFLFSYIVYFINNSLLLLNEEFLIFISLFLLFIVLFNLVSDMLRRAYYVGRLNMYFTFLYVINLNKSLNTLLRYIHQWLIINSVVTIEYTVIYFWNKVLSHLYSILVDCFLLIDDINLNFLLYKIDLLFKNIYASIKTIPHTNIFFTYLYNNEFLNFLVISFITFSSLSDKITYKACNVKNLKNTNTKINFFSI